MVTVDQLEVLLRTIPMYFLFAALSFYLFGWMNKKPKLSLTADCLVVFYAIVAIIVLLSGMIPPPETVGINKEHLHLVNRMILLFVLNGAFGLISLAFRIFMKKPFKPLVFAIFVVAIIIFFQSTTLSKIKFELNKPVPTEEAFE